MKDRKYRINDPEDPNKEIVYYSPVPLATFDKQIAAEISKDDIRGWKYVMLWDRSGYGFYSKQTGMLKDITGKQMAMELAKSLNLDYEVSYEEPADDFGVYKLASGKKQVEILQDGVDLIIEFYLKQAP